MKHKDVEPSLEGRSDLEQRTAYVLYIIRTILAYEKTIPGFAAMAWFPGVEREVFQGE